MNTSARRPAAVALLVSLLAAQAASACTAFQLKSVDGAQVYFRSMEFGLPFHSKVLVIPRGTEYSGSAPDGKAGLKWRVKYGVVGLNVNIAPTIVADGMNEKGLVVGMLYLPGYSQYLWPDETKTAQSLGSYGGLKIRSSAFVGWDSTRRGSARSSWKMTFSPRM